MEVLEVNEANSKFPVLSAKIKDICDTAYELSSDSRYDVSADIDSRINEITSNDIEEHKEEMQRIEFLLKSDSKVRRERFQLWNFNIANTNENSMGFSIPKHAPASDIRKTFNPFLSFPEELISNVKAQHQYRIIKEKCKKYLLKEEMQTEEIQLTEQPVLKVTKIENKNSKQEIQPENNSSERQPISFLYRKYYLNKK